MDWEAVCTPAGETLSDLVGRELRWRARRGCAALDAHAVTRLVAHAVQTGRLLTYENEVFLDAVLGLRARDARCGALHRLEMVHALRAGDGGGGAYGAADVLAVADAVNSLARHPSAALVRRGGST